MWPHFLTAAAGLQSARLRRHSDHVLHQLKRIEHAAKTGFGVGHDGQEVVDVSLVTQGQCRAPLVHRHA